MCNIQVKINTEDTSLTFINSKTGSVAVKNFNDFIDWGEVTLDDVTYTYHINLHKGQLVTLHDVNGNTHICEVVRDSNDVISTISKFIKTQAELIEDHISQRNELLSKYFKEESPSKLVDELRTLQSDVQLMPAHHLTPGDILVRLSDAECNMYELPPYPYTYPYPNQPVEVIKIISDPIPNSHGEIDDFVAKIPVYTQNVDGDIELIAVRPYTLNSRYFKHYKEE